jgi:hypothetical protein
MPSVAGLIFVAPLLIFVWMLQQIPAPDARDVAARSERSPMTGADRLAMIRRHGVRLLAVVAAYMLMTVLRSIRADFAPEIWTGLGLGNQPAVFTQSETFVALGVIVANGALVLVRDNRRAFLSALGISCVALCVALLSVAGQRNGALSSFMFMVLLGVGVYVPYVAVHTTIFERLIALTRERGNIGYLMYLADAAGYFGYAAVMLGRSVFPAKENFLAFFTNFGFWILASILGMLLLALALYARLGRESAKIQGGCGPLPAELSNS